MNYFEISCFDFLSPDKVDKRNNKLFDVIHNVDTMIFSKTSKF